MTAIGEAELRAKLGEVTGIPSEDFTKITAEDVIRLNDVYSSALSADPWTQARPPLEWNLAARQAELHEQRLGLLVKEIKVLNPTTQP